jgi:DNA-binding NarL/FixJ family response regulator
MPEKIRTLIVDDEPLARRNLRVLLEKDPQIEISTSVAMAAKQSKPSTRTRPI